MKTKKPYSGWSILSGIIGFLLIIIWKRLVGRAFYQYLSKLFECRICFTFCDMKNQLANY